MYSNGAIAVLGTFDTKPDEHLFLKKLISDRGLKTLTINVGTKTPSPFEADIDLYEEFASRDDAIEGIITKGAKVIREMYERGEISGIISAAGGTGTHVSTSIMKVLPLGVPKVMLSTVASKDMKDVVGTKDITMMHSVSDLLGINSISGRLLEGAAGAVCGMAQKQWKPAEMKRRIAMTFYGFVAPAADTAKECLEEMGYEVIAFHAIGTGGKAMEELAAEGYFDGILDLATHELVDDLVGGYCAGCGPQRLCPVPGRVIPRLVIPGGLDNLIGLFTRESGVPEQYKDRKVMFWDFRSGVRPSLEETLTVAGQIIEKLNTHDSTTKVLIPSQGWSVADIEGGALYEPSTNRALVDSLKEGINPRIEIREEDLHICDPAFGKMAATLMDEMVKRGRDKQAVSIKSASNWG